MIKLIGATVFSQGMSYALQLGAFFIFAKTLGPDGIGVLSIFRTVGQIIASFMWVGLTASIVYFIGNNQNYFLSLLKNCFKWFIPSFSLIIISSYIVPINEIPKLNFISHYIPHLLAIIFFLSLTNLFQILILSEKKYLHYNMFALGLGLAVFCGSILTGIVPRDIDQLNFAINAYIVSYAAVFIYGCVLLFLEMFKLNNKKIKELRFLNQFKIGFRGFISDIAGTLLFRIDLFIVGYFLTLKEVGIYSVALFGAEMITKIPHWSTGILSPMVASNEDGHIRRTLSIFYASIIVALFLGASLIFLILLSSDFISNLIGKEFKGAEVCLLLLLPRVIMQSGVAALAANLAGKGYPWYHATGCIVPLVFLILLDIILVPRIGINGAALANSLAFISSFVIFWVGFKKYNNYSVGDHIWSKYF